MMSFISQATSEIDHVFFLQIKRFEIAFNASHTAVRDGKLKSLGTAVEL